MKFDEVKMGQIFTCEIHKHEFRLVKVYDAPTHEHWSTNAFGFVDGQPSSFIINHKDEVEVVGTI
jgi:hypothetical protein